MKTTSTPLVALALAALFVTGCSTETGTANPAPASQDQTTSAVSPSEWASIEAEAGLPPEPDAATAADYVAALQAIDPDIVHGEPDKALDRGRNLCRSIADGVEGAQLVASAQARFTSPDHPGGFGSEVAERIVAQTRAHLCP